MSLVNHILTIYTWGAVSVLLFFLFSIARFYEKKSGRRSFFLAFLVPIILFTGSAIRYIYMGSTVAGDVWADIMRFLGGIILGIFGFFLLRLMMGGGRF